jgi:hypothetical protein
LVVHSAPTFDRCAIAIAPSTLGQAVSLIGTWLQIMAQGVVEFKLSGDSATALGVVRMLNMLPPLLFGPLVGA